MLTISNKVQDSGSDDRTGMKLTVSSNVVYTLFEFKSIHTHIHCEGYQKYMESTHKKQNQIYIIEDPKSLLNKSHSNIFKNLMPVIIYEKS